jgi:hypothetical protein
MQYGRNLPNYNLIIFDLLTRHVLFVESRFMTESIRQAAPPPRALRPPWS